MPKSPNSSFLLCLRPWLLPLALGACGEGAGANGVEGTDPAPPAAPEAADESPPVALRVYDPGSPAWYVATDGSGTSLILLAAKDASHNPVALNGVLFAVGDEWWRFEVDSEGRPQRIEGPRGTWLMSDYDETGFDLHEARPGQEPTHERVPLGPGQLAALSVLPLPLTGASTLDKGLAAGDALQWAERMRSMLECAGTAVAQRSTALQTVVRCSDMLLGAAASETVRTFIDVLATVSSGVTCIASGVAAFGGVTTPSALVGLAIACPSAVQGALELLRTPTDERFDRGFQLRVEAELVEDQSSPVLVYLVPQPGDDALRSVEADLALVGGATRQPLAFREGRWQWSGRLTPPEPYQRYVAFVIDGTEYFSGGLVDVRPALPPFELTLEASSAVVPLGASVSLTAEPTGGLAPYRMAWAAGGDLLAEETFSVERRPERRTRYQVAAADSAQRSPRFAEAELWVAVCGDGECSPEESPDLCATDCTPSPCEVEPCGPEPTAPAVADDGESGAPLPEVTTCGPGGNRERFQFTGTGARSDVVLDTTTGLVWHRGVEYTSADLPACDFDVTISAATPYCCRPPSIVPYAPGCNYLGFQQLCQEQGMRMATVDELLHLARDAGTCWENWESWSAPTGPTTAGFVRKTGLLVGSYEYAIPGDERIWYASDHVRCVR